MKAAIPQRNFQSDLVLKNKKTLINPMKKSIQGRYFKPIENTSEPPNTLNVEFKTDEIQATPILPERTELAEKKQVQLDSNIINTLVEESKPEKTEELEMKAIDKRKNSKNGTKIEPILKKKQTKKARNPSKGGRKESANGKKSREKTEKSVEKQKSIDQKENEENFPNNETNEFKKFELKFEDCTGQVNSSRVDLREKVRQITSKTFLNIKNLIKPQENIRLICMAFVGLFGRNLSEFNEDFYSTQEIKEWSTLQKFFESPGHLLNLIAKFEEFVEQNLIIEKSVNFTMEILHDFSNNNYNDENQDFNYDIIRLLAEFLNSACQFFCNYKINELKISPIKSIPEPQNKSGTLMETFDDPNPVEMETKKPKIEENKTTTIENNKILEKPKIEKKNRSVSNNSRATREKTLTDRKKEIEEYVAKKKGFTKKNKLERIMNLKVKKPSVTSVLKDYLNKSSDAQSSFSSKKKKNDQSSFNDGSQNSFHDEIKKAQKDIREMEATKRRVMILYEKQKKKDVEEQEIHKMKEILLKEKDDETKMKDFLSRKQMEEKNEIRSFRKELFLENRNHQKNFEETLRNKSGGNFARDTSTKKEEENKKNRQKEESLERLQNIQFIREMKKKKREEELKKQSEEYLNFKEEQIRQKKKEIMQMKENLEGELLQTLQLFQKEKIV